MNARTFLIKIHLCKNIGLVGELILAQFILDKHHIPTLREMLEILNISSKKAGEISRTWESEELKYILENNQKQAVTIFDAEYPKRLREIYQPPTVLFYRGDIALLNRHTLGIVGARDCSEYSVKILNKFIPQIVKKDIVTVSGLARGVDGIVHSCTLKNKGKTIGVLGNGLDVCYPKENIFLQESVSKCGLLISEYPLGSRPLRYHFPMRNRIIAGLSHSLLVTEARKKSGSLITANLALQENRNVLAVPGRIDKDLSRGCNELILAGAKPVLSTKEIIEDIEANIKWI